ncbi:hypothetical protein H2O64_16145 [Kordia sp. YSTF-M3]|uniref:Lipoprotein n=1 Tax=Kordia aestuariivivens TaxID=2759037 RepID=A0ABR7QCA7_9FLAO|nr:hypothetical protein [Kordia aestuariivivens]MBC8756209.1 hypothetical protein [Kordia aestuariivivens]
MKKIIYIVFIVFAGCSVFNTSKKTSKAKDSIEKNDNSIPSEIAKLNATTDSLIKISDKMEFSTKYITTRIIEGSLQFFDRSLLETGSGGFVTNIYTNQKTNEVVKAEYYQTINYKDTTNVTSGRLEITIYYKKENAYFAIYNNRERDKENVISDEKYYFQLNNTEKHTNDSQKKTIKYILGLSEEILSEK